MIGSLVLSIALGLPVTGPAPTTPLTAETAALTVYNAYKEAKGACRKRGYRLAAIAIEFDAQEAPLKMNVVCGGQQQKDI